jgi:hypothetical protein
MTDRELLELAAKAAGIRFVSMDNWPHQDNCRFWKHGDLCDCGAAWNPLADDGYAFRLAVKLRIRVQPATDDQYALANVVGSEEGVAEGCIFDGDPYSATRRAIVRAAASIGKDMK